MLAFRIEYLTGVVGAQDRADRRRAEWPPHPNRLYSALVASWGRGGRGEAGREALSWLERQDAPEIACAERVGWRDVVTHYVPRNDLPNIDKGRNGRTFPAALPEDPVVHLIWPAATPGEHRATLAALADQVAWLGHSSTLVAVRLVDEAPPPRLVPAATRNAEMSLRVPRPGRLADLDAAHEKGDLADPGAWQPYAKLGDPPPAAPSVHGEWMVFRRIGGVGMELRHTALLTHAVHRALVSRAEAINGPPVRAVISGRDADGAVTAAPHIAIVPLADLDHGHADGRIMGFAVVYPAGLDEDAVAYVDRTLAGLDHVKTSAGVMGVERWIASTPRGLNAQRYVKPSRHWVTVTPMMLDRFPKKALPAEEIVARAVQATGLPAPSRITFGAWPMVTGVPHVRLMRARPGRGHDRPLRHVLLEFDAQVRGPVLIGAGRFFGMGLCLPIADEQDDGAR
ncbi:MAG: type I-U CRISPR-associated protein Cas5/Cas6 [Alphaproteobacteria bacterium]|nr:type I-U CRISPR-associated protein Cas5/Cas6 [Alphaproteobacteria bacterium]